MIMALCMFVNVKSGFHTLFVKILIASYLPGKHSTSQQIEICAAIHLALDELKSITCPIVLHM